MTRNRFDIDRGFNERRAPVNLTKPQIRALYQTPEEPTEEDFWSGVALCIGLTTLIVGLAMLAYLGL
jgi:hypothetical protein